MALRTSEYPKRTIAAVDIGTNSAHMVVAEMDHIGEMRVLDSDKVTLRLGQAIDAEGFITEDGLERTAKTLSHMREIAASYGATLRAVATHAAREARNYKQFLARMEKDAGVKVDIIDGIEEARLVFLGMRYGMALAGTTCLGMDVGGGSTEIIVAKDDDIRFVSSFKLGAVTLTEKYFGRGGPTPEKLRQLREHVVSRLAPLPQEARRFSFDRALASSGTAKALAGVHAKLWTGAEVSDPNGYTVPRQDLLQIVGRLSELLLPSRIKDYSGLDASRAEIILAGAIIIEEVTKLLKVKEWVVTSYGLREGLVADTFYRAYGRVADDLPDVQWHSVLQFARRLQLNEAHALQVKRLSLRLFEQLAPVLKPNDQGDDYEEDIKLLKAAAYLRESGKFLSAPNYHKHSQYLISNSRLPGFTEPERAMMGLVARFQRKGTPSPDNRYCTELTLDEIERLKLFSGIVRLAAALDRSRQGRVLDATVVCAPGAIEITVHHDPGYFPDVELHKAGLEQAALEKCFDRKVTIAARPSEMGPLT